MRARRALDESAVARIDAGLERAGGEAGLAPVVRAFLRERGLSDGDTAWLERGALTALGKEAVPGILLGDAFGHDGFAWPESAQAEAAIPEASEAVALTLERRPDWTQPSLSGSVAGLGEPLPEKPYFTMDKTRSQLGRLYRKSEAWRHDGWLRSAYRGDEGKYFGSLGSSEYIAFGDVFVNVLHRERPSAFTRLLIKGMRIYEWAIKQLPLELRDEAGDYFEQRFRGAPIEAEGGELADLDELSSPGSGFPEPRSRFMRLLWDELDWSFGFSIRPRLKLEEPSVKLALRLKADWNERVRLRARLAYDSKDQELSAVGGLGAEF